MSSANAYLTVAGIGVDVVYKDIKNLHISVYPPVGRVRVAAPESTNEETVRLAIVNACRGSSDSVRSSSWHERQTEREMKSGESPLRLGKAVSADVLASTSGNHHVEINGQSTLGHHPEGSDARKRADARPLVPP